MDRKNARACAMKLIYEWEMGGDGGEDTRLQLLELKPGENEADYMERMFSGVTANREQLDAGISAHLHAAQQRIARKQPADVLVQLAHAERALHLHHPTAIFHNKSPCKACKGM